jgi:outer membrane protein assembly factor BamA
VIGRALVALGLLVWSCPALAQPAEQIAEIRIHGNHTTPDADILALSGLAVGQPATEARLQDAQEKLRMSRRFEGAEVRRRYLSIEDPSSILVMIVVDEHPASTPDNPVPGPLRRLRFATMWLPILNYADGYGFTYGVRFSFVEPFGRDTRISVPLSWGGERRAGFEVERTFTDAVVSRVSGGVATYRRVNQHYDVPDLRYEAKGRLERTINTWLRAGGGGRVASVDFGARIERHSAAGFDVTVDTRLDPSFPRNAIHAVAGWEHMDFDDAAGTSRWFGDLRGYAPLGGSRVLVLRALFSHAADPLPPSEQALLGGSQSLRGYPTGYRAGDVMAAASAEVRVPLISPLRIGRFGVRGFVDVGAAWFDGQAMKKQPFDRGIGGGVYFGLPALMLDLDVAWPESGNPRVHFGMGVTL